MRFSIDRGIRDELSISFRKRFVQCQRIRGLRFSATYASSRAVRICAIPFVFMYIVLAKHMGMVWDQIQPGPALPGRVRVARIKIVLVSKSRHAHIHTYMGGEFKHLVLVKFRDGVAVEPVLKDLEKLASEMDTVKSFIWGQDIESQEMLRQGFTHTFIMTFNSREEFSAFAAHPRHVEFSASFSAAIEKAVLLDFPTVVVKPSAA